MILNLDSFLVAHGDAILRISKPVSLEHVGALTAQARQTVLFENIRGYPGFRLADLLFFNREAQSRVLGCEPAGVVRRLAEILQAGPKPLRQVEDAPCHEQVFTGADVDLSMLPVVRQTDADPYPCTTSFAIHRDPETGQYNQMFPRSGVLGRKEMVTSFVSATANRILAGHRAAGTAMPQAIVIGAHPAWELCGCYSHPHKGWWEMELFESITGHPGHVVKCKTVDLVVPADASIVIEGYVSPTRTVQDGPTLGPTMLYAPYTTAQPVFEVTAITMSRHPIYRNHQMTPFTDHQELPRLFHEAILYERLRAMGLQVHDVHFPQGGGSLSIIIQIEPAYEGQVTDALLAVLGSPWANTKMVIAVDPDVDIYDYREVHYAVATRVDPSRDVIIVENARASAFDPSARIVTDALSDNLRPAVVGKWGINATKRVNWRRARPVGWGEVKLEDYR